MKLGLDEAEDRIKMAGTNIKNLRYVCDTTLTTECEKKLKSLLIKVKEDREISGLKLTFIKKKIMSSGPITLQEKMGNNRNSDRLYFLGLQNHYSDCRHGIKTCLFLGRKPMTKLDSILKNRDITLPTNVQLVKVIIFPVVMYECESWIIKKAEP